MRALLWSAMALGLLALAVALTSCQSAEPTDTLAELDVATYQAQVDPYVGARCATLDCHGMAGRWVYHVVPAPLAIYKDHTLRLTAKGDISTWTCLPGLQELVCHDLECKMRDGDPIKSRNLQQGFKATKDWYLDVTHDGKLTYGDPEPLIYFTGDSIGSEILGILALVTHNLKDPGYDIAWLLWKTKFHRITNFSIRNMSGLGLSLAIMLSGRRPKHQ